MKKILVVCTTDSMIWNFLVPHIQALQAKGYEVECACSITGDYFKNLKSIYGLKMHAFGFERSPYNLKNVKAYRALNDFVKKNKFDIIFCHEPMGGVMGRLVGHQNGCKVIYMAHGFHFHKGAPKKNWLIYYTAEKTLALKTDVIITINHEDYRLAKKNFKVKKVYYVPGVGIDLKKFGSHNVDKEAKRKEVGVPVGTTWLLTVGELIPRKNHRVLIDAIKDIPGVFLTIVGDGELTEETQKYIDENQLGQKVKLLGYRTDIDELNEASDVFVFPSLQEGLPVALMEAMACGKPIACSNIRGNSDLINEKGGVLFDPHSVEDCKNAIEKVLCGDKESMGIHNAIAIKKYSLESVEPRLQQIIDTTTAGIPGGGGVLRLLTRYKYRKQFGFNSDSVVLISVAELIPRKNHEVILRAISEIKDFDVQYLIVGIGELEEYLKNLCNELHISDKVHFLGYRNDIKELNWSSDICVFPSRIEGLGMAAIEAMACELPIVTSNIHGINDYSKDGITGFKAAPDDVEGFREAIVKLCENPDLRMSIGYKNSKRIQKYSVEKSVDAVSKIFENTSIDIL